MSCHEIEALRLGLITVLGVGDDSDREHARQELEGHLEGPIEGLVEADSLAEIERHLDAALVDLESDLAAMEADDPAYDYTRGRLLELRNAERAVKRLRTQGESVVDGLGEAHDALHETFPVEE
ncbi:cobalamin biosynthesis protein [Halobiforma lacisalsi AJ5]|uniref:Cobalamin biosynthesis protein n=1 Tax=Natronobacterium lacisalsi AJ5 TaxID=358396 RepID=M0LR38_NATLA|nr:DUF3209 family protein [Halobiforma lacisalsi]APW99663.1 cobalamin biosynthesis protein [Halobiforma lacisalsi AJ5]EMA35548.1 hypothetical protein C445_04928 [Halobiforma lacisalsi AJ5]